MTTPRVESHEEAERVLRFWLGPLDANGRADAEHAQRWWSKDASFDARIREELGGLHRAIASNEHEAWLTTPRSCLAYVIVLDQFSRNMYRDQPDSFASDSQALRAAERGIDAGFDAQLAHDEQPFLYMPLMHSELLANQERCVQLFTRFGDARQLKFAQMHRDIIARFGRFPHRNTILGRASTPEEQAFLKQPGSSF